MYNKITLKNGLRVVIEEVPHIRSVTMGLWIKAGSSNEKKSNNGVSHFIEHMLFKGTKNRTAKDLAETIDNIGGQLNAFTAKECTCYYARVLDTHLDIAVDVISDMLFNSKFDEEDIAKEKKVVLEEINLYDDTPEEVVHDLISKAIFENNSLGFPILGQAKTLEDMNKKDIIDYFNKYYVPQNAVISIVGNINTKETIKLIEDYFGHWENVKSNIITSIDSPPTFNNNLFYQHRDTEQLHLCLGMQGVHLDSEFYYPLMVLNNIFGGCMSSRLFQKIREDKGLAYSIYSYPLLYQKTGAFIIYTGVNPNHLMDVVDMVFKEIDLLKRELISKEALYRSKEQLKGNYIIDYESSSARMMALGRSELLLNRIVPLSKGLDNIDTVTLDQIQQVVKIIFDETKRNISYVGRINQDDNIKLKSLLPVAQEI